MTFDPQMSEWGNPAAVMCSYPALNKIGAVKETRGTETSKYPEEKKETSIPQVAASERGRAQTRSSDLGLWTIQSATFA